MREQNRSLQLRLRDIEVANDDYERQARNTSSSMEDMESKLNVSIERGVLLDEEMRSGESEREALRIENQRLRDELGDLKVESEITLEKLRLAGKTVEQLRARKPNTLAVKHLRATSPGSEASGITSVSPTASTPPQKSDTASETQTPPSPPLSDEALLNAKVEPRTPMPSHRRSLLPDAGITPRPSAYGGQRAMTCRHSRGPSIASSASNAPSDARSMRAPVSRVKALSPAYGNPGGLPRSESLYQMKSLRSRMQKIEERVHSARSKLPAPRNSTTPKASPRSGSAMSNAIPSSITVRRCSKRPSSVATSTMLSNEEESVGENAEVGRRESQSHVKRMSYGLPRPPSRASAVSDRPPSRASAVGERPPSRSFMLERPPSSAAASRPGSRLSIAGAGAGAGIRPESRNGHHHTGGSTFGADRRPRSSMGGNYNTITGTPRTHRPSASVSELRRRAVESDESASTVPSAFTPHRRTTLDRGSILPASMGPSRRQSNVMSVASNTNKSVGRRPKHPGRRRRVHETTAFEEKNE